MPTPKRKDPRKTIQLCNALYDPTNPQSPRCMLSEGHGPTPHECVKTDGTKLTWPS